MTLLILAYLTCLGVFMFVVLSPPDGWEDEDGFHYGTEVQKDDHNTDRNSPEW